jgi:hypothetical protein
VNDGGFRLENRIDVSFCLESIMTNKLKKEFQEMEKAFFNDMLPVRK